MFRIVRIRQYVLTSVGVFLGERGRGGGAGGLGVQRAREDGARAGRLRRAQHLRAAAAAGQRQRRQHALHVYGGTHALAVNSI